MPTILRENSLESNALNPNPLTVNALTVNALTVPTQGSAHQTLTSDTTPRRLPYQPSQCAEFLHLQAETEALLQKLYIEHHRRTLCAQQSQSAII